MYNSARARRAALRGVSAALALRGAASLTDTTNSRCDGEYAYRAPRAPAPPAPPAPPATPATAPAAELAFLLRSALGDAAVETSPAELERYGRDEWSYHSGPPPDLVAFPQSAAHVSLVLREARRLGVPIVARAGGTSLEGHTTTPRRGCVLDVSRMDRVVRLRPDDLDVTVQPGVGWQELNKLLAPHGLFFPVDPGPGALVGGMVGTGCSGTNAVRHGAMKANVLSLECVLADGTLVRTASRARKSSAGFDLTSLVTGSEGTLAVVTEATLRLQPLPERVAVAVSSFPTLRDASAAAAAILRSGVQVAAVELLDARMVAAVNAQSGFAYPPERPLLLVKTAGSAAKVADDGARVEQVAARHGGSAFAYAADDAGRDRLWEARKVALWSAGAQHPGKKIATTDVCVPLGRLADLMDGFERETRAGALPVYAVAHAGDGNAHHFIVFDPARPEEVAEARRLNAALVRTAIAMDGTCTGEHGTGVGKLGYLAEELGEGNLSVMRRIKHALDPENVLNPGKKIPPESAPRGADELSLTAPACMH
jgi:D-lactate dehydrogenase (cytochrome)